MFQSPVGIQARFNKSIFQASIYNVSVRVVVVIGMAHRIQYTVYPFNHHHHGTSLQMSMDLIDAIMTNVNLNITSTLLHHHSVAM